MDAWNRERAQFRQTAIGKYNRKTSKKRDSLREESPCVTRPVASVNVRHAWIKTDVQMQTCFSGALERSAQQAAQRARLSIFTVSSQH